jgi:hypothetical protein
MLVYASCRVKCGPCTACTIVTAPVHSLKKWVEISRPSSISKARRLGEKQHIEAFGAGHLVICAWYFYCDPRVIIDKARLPVSQMTLERFLIYPISSLTKKSSENLFILAQQRLSNAETRSEEGLLRRDD